MNNLLSNQYVLHLPGSGKEQYGYLLDAAKDIKFDIDKSITVISPMTPDYEEKSVLAYQLNNNNINWINPITIERMTMTDKIDFILSALKQCKTKYALILDGGDTCICKNIDGLFIEKYNNLNKPVIYNSTSKRFPPIKVEPIGFFLKEGKQSFLNAGVCFGDIENLKKVYFQAKELKGQVVNEYNSEQFLIRHTRVRMPELIGVDSDNIIFKSAHKGELDKNI